jgi:hypothetical protein
MASIVAFNYPQFVAQFPEFEQVDQATISGWFTVAGATICRNDGLGPVSNATTQMVLMMFATAHLIQLFVSQLNGQPNTESPAAVPPPNIVGRISSATEGSVAVQAEMSAPPSAAAAFWYQTRYGTAWWAMTAPYRTFRYLPGPQRYFGPYGLGNAFTTTLGGPFWGGGNFVLNNGACAF